VSLIPPSNSWREKSSHLLLSVSRKRQMKEGCIARSGALQPWPKQHWRILEKEHGLTDFAVKLVAGRKEGSLWLNAPDQRRSLATILA
jgi:hypothetical protein